jgi:group II intron reverse transcriptase/maturase
MQRKLSQWATDDPAKKFVDLYSLLCNEVWLRVAANKALRNEGSETAGVDGKTKSNFLGDLDGNIARLKETLKAKVFEPMPVRRVYIPKPNSQKKRPLGIPTLLDRVVQEALRMILEPIWESDFSQRSYGFRPNRSTYDAIAYISNRLAGNHAESYQWVIEGDIASYFDTIPHRRLIKAVKKRVADRNIRDLLWKFLRAGVMYRGEVQETMTGTPQGGIVSPLLANIYLHELDRYMESNYLKLPEHRRSARRKQGKSNFLYVRYADDFVVLCNGTKAQALEMKEELKHVLDNMGLKLSEEKTKVTHITEGFQFLGYWIERSIGTRGEMVPKVLIPKSAIMRFRHAIRRILAPNTTSDSTVAKITAMNRLTRGWCEYYRSTNGPAEIFNKLDKEIYEGMAHWLGKKYDIGSKKVRDRYQFSLGLPSGLGTKTITLLSPHAYKAKKLLVKTWHNPYTANEAIIQEKYIWYESLWSGYENRKGRRDLREEVIQLKGTVCALNMPDICESKGKPLHPSEVEIDHIIPRKKFKDPTEADRMGNLRPTCTPCHREKTKTDLRVLSRMRR